MSEEFRKEIQIEIDSARNDLHEFGQGLQNRLTALEEKVKDINHRMNRIGDHDSTMYVGTLQKKIEALEETQTQIQKVILFELFNDTERFKVKERIEALESDIKLLKTKLIELFEKLNEQLKDVIILPNFRKQLEDKP